MWLFVCQASVPPGLLKSLPVFDHVVFAITAFW